MKKQKGVLFYETPCRQPKTAVSIRLNIAKNVVSVPISITVTTLLLWTGTASITDQLAIRNLPCN